jgi:hypothetical protein
MRRSVSGLLLAVVAFACLASPCSSLLALAAGGHACCKPVTPPCHTPNPDCTPTACAIPAAEPALQSIASAAPIELAAALPMPAGAILPDRPLDHAGTPLVSGSSPPLFLRIACLRI